MRAHPLQSNVNPSAASVLSPSLNQQSISSGSAVALSLCVRACMWLHCYHVHTNEMTINDHGNGARRDNDPDLRHLSNEHNQKDETKSVV